jgi:hypothetical protein
MPNPSAPDPGNPASSDLEVSLKAPPAHTKFRKARTRVKSQSPPPATPPDEPPGKRSLLAVVLSYAVTYIVLLLVFSLLEQVFDLTTPEGRTKLTAQNNTVTRALSRMQPLSLAEVFCSRLTEQHKWSLLQWDAPFNADEARRNLTVMDQKAGFDCSSSAFEAEIGIPDFRAGNKPCYFREPGRTISPQEISYSAPSLSLWNKKVQEWDMERPDLFREEQQLDRLAFTSENDRLALIPGPDINSASAYSIFAAFLLALPDAYYAVVSALTPQGPGLWLVLLRLFLILAVVYATLTVLIDLKAKGAGFHFGWVLLLCLILIPIVISGVAGLLRLLSLDVTHAFGNFLVAPALASTTSALFTGPVRWAGREIAQHHTVEAVLKRLPKAWLGEE